MDIILLSPERDTYISVVEADIYFSSRLDHTIWDTSTENDKLRALCQASEAIDRLSFTGIKTDEAQALEFPRDSDTEIPIPIMRACALCAKELLDGADATADVNDQRTVSVGYATVRKTFDTRVKLAHVISGIPSMEAWMLLQPYLSNNTSLRIDRV